MVVIVVLDVVTSESMCLWVSVLLFELYSVLLCRTCIRSQ